MFDIEIWRIINLDSKPIVSMRPLGLPDLFNTAQAEAARTVPGSGRCRSPGAGGSDAFLAFFIQPFICYH
jgi:hypothetical protein